MKQHFAALLSLALAASVPAPSFAKTVLDNASRPADEVSRDADRKPLDMVKFAKIKTGQTVVDMLPGAGYFTRVFSQAVGAKGKVIALVSDQYAAQYPKAGTDIQTLAAEPAYRNVEAAIRSLGDVAPAGTADRVWTAQNYHDLKSAKLPPETAAGVNKAVYAALKPGGYYIVLDHAAASGSGLRDVDTLHRIDPAALKAEILAAGFKFDGESKALAHPNDDHTKMVFDPAIRGKTDQIIYRFVKPKK